MEFRREASELTVSSDGRTVRQIQLQPIWESLNVGFNNASRASTKVLLVGGKRVGFFHVWSGSEVIRSAMNEALADFETQRVEALLLDFRGGYGGMTEDNIAALRESVYLSQIPVYVLIDDSLRSGKELVVGIIKRDELGTLVGAKTAGEFLLGGRFSFFDGKYLLYLAVGDGPPPVIPGIGQIEGNGIEPQVSVAPCRRYCAGQDPILQAALDLISH
jgi:C-terminal processing protease CtpA/Prc